MLFCLEIVTCDPFIYTMDHSKFIASIRIVHIRVLLITIFKFYVYDETSNLELVIFVLMSLTELVLQQSMHAENTLVMESYYEVYF